MAGDGKLICMNSIHLAVAPLHTLRPFQLKWPSCRAAWYPSFGGQVPAQTCIPRHCSLCTNSFIKPRVVSQMPGPLHRNPSPQKTTSTSVALHGLRLRASMGFSSLLVCNTTLSRKPQISTAPRPPNPVPDSINQRTRQPITPNPKTLNPKALIKVSSSQTSSRALACRHKIARTAPWHSRMCGYSFVQPKTLFRLLTP